MVAPARCAGTGVVTHGGSDRDADLFPIKAGRSSGEAWRTAVRRRFKVVDHLVVRIVFRRRRRRRRGQWLIRRRRQRNQFRLRGRRVVFVRGWNVRDDVRCARGAGRTGLLRGAAPGERAARQTPPPRGDAENSGHYGNPVGCGRELNCESVRPILRPCMTSTVCASVFPPHPTQPIPLRSGRWVNFAMIMSRVPPLSAALTLQVSVTLTRTTSGGPRFICSPESNFIKSRRLWISFGFGNSVSRAIRLN